MRKPTKGSLDPEELALLVRARLAGYTAGYYSKGKINPHEKGLIKMVWVLGFDTGAYHKAQGILFGKQKLGRKQSKAA